MSAVNTDITTPMSRRSGEVLHWRQYLMEAALLGAFMISACVFAIALEHPASPIRRTIESAFLRRAIMGLAMGATAIALIYSRWGRRSGAHMNPAVTLSFLRLGRIGRGDAAGYILAQFVGAIVGVALISSLMRSAVSDPAVNFVATHPGVAGAVAAWFAECAIAALLMTTVLCINRHPALAPYTGWFAGLLVALYITFEAPISGMSMNPARSLGSAFVASDWPGLWIYFTAPPLGMLGAVEFIARLTRQPDTLCCKLSHSHKVPCIFRCNCVAYAPATRST
ncbi:MAG: aquaporin family protein [Planctomycetes bacterium]|nr:aquaporin family protein [Planctomycetota bacterium]